MRISDWSSDVCSSDLKRKLSPACGRRGPFQGGKGPKTPCAGRTSVRLLPHRFLALLAECGPAPTRTSLCSNKGALLPHSAAMLCVLYGALSHPARPSTRYRPVFPFHPTALWCYAIRSEDHTSDPQPLNRIS